MMSAVQLVARFIAGALKVQVLRRVEEIGEPQRDRSRLSNERLPEAPRPLLQLRKQI